MVSGCASFSVGIYMQFICNKKVRKKNVGVSEKNRCVKEVGLTQNGVGRNAVSVLNAVSVENPSFPVSPKKINRAYSRDRVFLGLCG
jgi:hypothetical protein